jgi:hypothetical protein
LAERGDETWEKGRGRGEGRGDGGGQEGEELVLPRGRTVNRRRRKHEARLKERKGQGWLDLGDTYAASPSLQVICPRHGKVEKGGRGI